MSNLEQDLRDMLARRADATPTNPGDWQDLTVRMARKNRRTQRVMAGALALVLIVGPLAGFAIARAAQDTEPSGRVTAAGPSGSLNTNQVATSSQAIQSLGIAYGGVGGVKLDKLFRRTTGDGIAVRAFITRSGASSCQGDGWCPPVDCYPDASITGELSTDAAVGFATGSHFAGTTSNLKLTGGGVFGANGEGSPARWTLAQTSDRVAKVRVSFAGGGHDEMAPVDGVVLLAALTDPTNPGGTVEALDGSGAVLEHADAASATTWDQLAVVQTVSGNAVVSGSTGESSSSSASTTTVVQGTATTTTPPPPAPTPGDASSSSAVHSVTQGPATGVTGATRAECIAPPPSLPAPGLQPANPAAAKAEVEQAFATAYAGGPGNDDAKRAVVQDSDSLRPTIDQARKGSFAQQVNDASAVVSDVVFTSPTEAAVRYDINVKSSTNFTGRIGKALFLDGHWKVARVTVCADISLAGVTCPAK